MAVAVSSSVSPIATKRSLRKRSRPSILTLNVPTSPKTKQHARNSHSHSHAAAAASKVRPPVNKRLHSDITELHGTVTDLQSQVSSASTQMRELREMVEQLIELHRESDTFETAFVLECTM